MTPRRLAVAALAVPFLAACSGLLTNDKIGAHSTGAIDPMFESYVAIGTSIGAGVQSGGINDSTQRQAYPYLLAVGMGLTPGASWHYPSLTNPGCPPPYADIRTRTRIATVPGGCAFRDPSTAWGYENNASIPGIRVAQATQITRRDYPPTDTLALAVFLTGGMSPVDMMALARPTFVTLEIGANDVLGAATAGVTALLTPLDSFQVQFTRLADKIDETGARVAVANVPNVSRTPRFTRGSTLFCLASGLCTGVPATAPFSLPTFLIAANCAPTGAGNTYLLPFETVGQIAGVLGAGGAAKLDCANDTAQVNVGAGFVSAGATLNGTEYATVSQRVTDINTFIASQADSRGWALVNFDSALGANAAQIPPIPNLSTTNPNNLMGPLFSQDGVHPSAAGQQMIYTAFKNAINAKWGTALP